MSRIKIDYRKNWLTIFNGTPDEIETLVPQIVRSEPTSDEPLVRIIRGTHCGNIEQLMNEISAAFQFPYYFGHNWDALYDCIRDLWWLKANNYLLVITDFDKLLEGKPDERRTFIEIMKDTSSEWAKSEGWAGSDFKVKKGVGFFVILQQLDSEFDMGLLKKSV